MVDILVFYKALLYEKEALCRKVSGHLLNCGEHGVISGVDWNPYITTEPIGQTNFLGELDAQVSLTESGGCSGDYVGDTTGYIYSWSSFDTSIATISGATDGAGVNVYGVSGGSVAQSGTQGIVLTLSSH